MDNLRNDKQKLMRELMAASFAAFEMQLFLDTHPYDQRALNMHQTYAQRANALMTEYQSKYGPITARSAGTKCPWQWAALPWTWERGE